MKRIKNLTCVLLVVVISLSFPFSAHAKQYSFNGFVLAINNGATATSNTLPITYTNGTGNDLLNNGQTVDIILLPSSNVDLEAGETLSFFAKTTLSRYGNNGNIYAFIGATDENGYYNYYRATGSYNASTMTFSSGDFSFDEDMSVNYFRFQITGSQYQALLDAWTMSQACAMTVSAAGYNVSSNGFFNNIISWLTTIRDKIVDLLDGLVDQFIDLTTNIRLFTQSIINSVQDYFSTLTGNLRTWFLNVGTWFSSLGDRISGFFTNIWNNFTSWWSGLWTVDDGYFTTYKSNWETWARAHFGLLFDFHDLLDEIVDTLQGLGESPSGEITIPEISFPFANGVLIPETTFNFNTLLNSHAILRRCFELFQLVLSGFAYYFIFRFGLRTFTELLGEGRGDS